jgi:3-dehydroquinate dehydratase-2
VSLNVVYSDNWSSGSIRSVNSAPGLKQSQVVSEPHGHDEMGGSVARILVLHGPNLNLLGTRERHIYGQMTLAEINQMLEGCAQQAGHTVEIWQSNHEGTLVDYIQQYGAHADVLIINPAAYTHTSVAIRDAILAVGIPTIEVHLSNIHRREAFRRHSYLADIAVGQVAGFGSYSYRLAFEAACSLVQPQTSGE